MWCIYATLENIIALDREIWARKGKPSELMTHAEPAACMVALGIQSQAFLLPTIHNQRVLDCKPW